MASQSRIEALKGTPEINYGDECCSICLREFVRGDICRVLPRCGHMFHKDCIDQWLLNRSLKCPVCRRQAVVEEKPRKARKRISLEWILLGAGATYVVILYGSLAYSLYGYHKGIQYTCNTIMKLRSKDENNLEFEILEESS